MRGILVLLNKEAVITLLTFKPQFHFVKLICTVNPLFYLHV